MRRFASPIAGWATAGDLLMRTTDGGACVDRAPVPGVRAATPSTPPRGSARRRGAGGLRRLRRFRVRRTAARANDDGSLLATSHDGGATWTEHALEHRGRGWTCAWRSADVGAAVVQRFKYGKPVRDGESVRHHRHAHLGTDLMVTEDGGQTWRKTLSDDLASFAIAWAPSGRLIAGEATGEIRVSDDGGRT